MADDTIRIQTRLNSPDQFGLVTLPPGTYDCGPLNIPASVRWLFGHDQVGTVLRFLPNQPKDTQLLKVRPNVPQEICISNLTLDMNRTQQGDPSDNALERQAGLLLSGEHLTAGRLSVRLNAVDVRDSASDGFYVYHNVDALVEACQAKNCFRSGLGITGKASKTAVEWCDFKGCGLDVEPGVDSHAVEVSVKNTKLDDFDVALTAGSKFAAYNVEHRGGLFYLCCHNKADYYVTDSRFISNPDGRIKIRLAGRSKFERCKFTGHAGNKSNVINVLWERSGVKTDQALTFDTCVIDGDGSLGIDAGIDEPIDRNQLSILNTKILAPIAKGAAAQGSPREKRGLPWILTGSTHNGVPLK